MNHQAIDLLISHHQIQVRSTDFDENKVEWGNVNLEQGAILHDDYLVFDPLPDEAFGAIVNIYLNDSYHGDDNAQRVIKSFFAVNDKYPVEVLSVAEKYKINIPLNGFYNVYFEICEGIEEIYYNIKFIPAESKTPPIYLIDDPWGGEKNKPLVEGFA